MATDEEALAALLSNRAWFDDPARPERDAARPPVIVVDDFYADPDAVRQLALDLPYARYSPPDAAVVGDAVAAANAHRGGPWLASAFVVYHGAMAQRPFYGHRHQPPALRDRLETVVGDRIDANDWATGGDYWNGAFHLIEAGYGAGGGAIHHHFKPGDVEDRGWSGLIYLSPDAPATAGTSLWRHHGSGRCVASYGEPYHRSADAFEQVHLIANRYNRLVLFRENVWHRVEHGFGQGHDARLTQTLFFRIDDEA